MTSFLTPTTMPEWMNQVNRRLAVIERHRHGSSGSSDGSSGSGDITTNKWFRASVANNLTTQIQVDGNVKVPLDAKADPYGMLNSSFQFVPPRSGPVQFSAGAHMQPTSTVLAHQVNFHGLIVDLDASNFELIRGTQYVNLKSDWTAGGGQQTVISGIVEVTAGHRYEFQCYVQAQGVTKMWALTHENCYFSGAYADSGDPIRQFPVSGSAELHTWTPSIITSGNPFVWGTNAVRRGYWRWVGPHHIHFAALMTIGTNANGGTGDYYFALPPWGTADPTIDIEQGCQIKVYTGGNGNFNYTGTLVVAGGALAGAGVAGYLDGVTGPIGSGKPALGNDSNFALSGDILLAGGVPVGPSLDRPEVRPSIQYDDRPG